MVAGSCKDLATTLSNATANVAAATVSGVAAGKFTYEVPRVVAASLWQVGQTCSEFHSGVVCSSLGGVLFFHRICSLRFAEPEPFRDRPFARNHVTSGR